MATPKHKVSDPFASIAEPVSASDPFASIAEPVERAPSPFAVGKENKEGIYQMQSPGGELIKVPYSKVMQASKEGYKISPDDRLRYGKDKLWELRGYKGSRDIGQSIVSTIQENKEFNPDTDLPESYHTVEAETPWYKPSLKQVERKALDLLPTAGGVAGGIIGGGGGLETGPGAIATGTAGAAAGGGAAEAVRQEAMEQLFPFEHRMTPKESAESIGIQAGLQGLSELTGRTVTKGLSFPQKYLEQTALGSKAAGISLYPSEAAGKSPSIIEKTLKGSVFTSGMMEDFRATQNKETQAAVSDLANTIDNFKGSSEDLGKVVKNGIKEHQQQFRVVQSKLYHDIDNVVGKRVIKVPVYAQVATKVLDPSGNPVMKTIQTGTEDRIVDNVMPSLKGHYDKNGNYVEGLKDFAKKELDLLDQEEKIFSPSLLKKSRRMLQTILKAPDNINFEAIANARSDSLRIARKLDKAMSDKESGFAKRMAQLFDESMMDAAEKSGIPSLPEMIRNANKITSEEHQKFEQALVKTIVKTKKPDAIASLLTGDIGNQEARDLFAILPVNIHAPVQREVILDKMREATDPLSRKFNEREFAKSIAEMGDERGKIIFGSNWDNVKRISSILERINGPMGMSGSAASLQNAGIIKGFLGGSGLFAGIGAAAAGHPLVGAGIAGAELASVLGYAVTYRSLAKAITEPESAMKIIKALQIAARSNPYILSGTLNVAVDPDKSLTSVKNKATQIKEKVQSLSPQTPVPTGVTHTYNPVTQSIVPVQ